MKKSDTQLGKPTTLYKGTTAELAALSAIEGMQAYDTTLDKFVYYDGANWVESGTDENAIHVNEAGEINAITEKTTLVDNDVFLIEDSEASFAKKKASISLLKSRIDELESLLLLQSCGYADTPLRDHFTSPTINPYWTGWTITPATTVQYNRHGHYLYPVASAAQYNETCFLYRSFPDGMPLKIVLGGLYIESAPVAAGLRVDDGTDDNYIEFYLTSSNFMANLVTRIRQGGASPVTTVRLTEQLLFIPTLQIVRISSTSYRTDFGLIEPAYTYSHTVASIAYTRVGLFIRNLTDTGSRRAWFHSFSAPAS